MTQNNPSTRLLRRTATLALALGMGAVVAGAQTQSVSPAGDPFTQQTAAVAPLYSSSSAQQATPAEQAAPAPTVLALNAAPMDFFAGAQYGGGRGGRPRYRGGNSNPDGSPKWTGFAGVGLSQPVGNTWHYLTPSYAYQVGFGRQWSYKFALPIEFDYDHFGFTGQQLGNQLAVENQFITVYNAANPGADIASLSSLDGTSHVWSFSIDPTYTYAQGKAWGSYVVGGVGFYHKTANYTIPGSECDIYGYCYAANQTVDKYTSNAPGFSAGLGITYKFSRFSNERFYAEARYVFVDNQHKPGYSVANLAAITATSTNLDPGNSNRTTYFPIKFGLRF